MSAAPETNPSCVAVDLDIAADQAIAACGGDAREAVKALIVANGFLEAEVEKLKASVSEGYSHGRFDVPRDRMAASMPPWMKPWIHEVGASLHFDL